MEDTVEDFSIILPVDNPQGKDIIGQRDLELFGAESFFIAPLHIAVQPITAYMNTRQYNPSSIYTSLGWTCTIVSYTRQTTEFPTS